LPFHLQDSVNIEGLLCQEKEVARDDKQPLVRRDQQEVQKIDNLKLRGQSEETNAPSKIRGPEGHMQPQRLFSSH